MPTTTNGAIELYYETFGMQDDPVVICLPGMGNQLLIYPEAFCLALVDRGFFVIRMDNRDAGLSTATADSDTYLSDMADDVVAVLDAVGVETAVLLGLSLGGMVAQQLAIDHPERVRALVSLASTPGMDDLPYPSDEVAAALTAPSKDTAEEQIEADMLARKLWSNPDWYDPDQLRIFFTELHERAFVPGGGMRQFVRRWGPRLESTICGRSTCRPLSCTARTTPCFRSNTAAGRPGHPRRRVPRDRGDVSRLRVPGVAAPD